jgi:hypothetical protein
MGILKKLFGGSRSPICFKCGGLLGLATDYPAGIIYKGVICKACGAVTCLDCQGSPPNKPCRKCGGAVSPAFGDLLAR